MDQVVPPRGWTFEQDEVTVNIDGENDVCSQNKECFMNDLIGHLSCHEWVSLQGIKVV